jgi:hypothetical protein
MSFFPPRRLRRNWMTIALWLTGPVALAGFVFLWIGSSRFIIPKRRPLEDRHHQLLAAPAEFGLELEPIAVTLPIPWALRKKPDTWNPVSSKRASFRPRGDAGRLSFSTGGVD